MSTVVCPTAVLREFSMKYETRHSFRPILMLAVFFIVVGCLGVFTQVQAQGYVYVTEFGSKGTAPGQFDRPLGVAVDSQDRIIVSDFGNNRVQVCDDQGGCTAFGSLGTAPGRFDTPAGVAVDNQDRIITSEWGFEFGNDRIQLCNHQGTCTVLGEPGTALGQFDDPHGLAVDSQGRIIVADQSNHRIQICDDQGICSAFGSLGTAPGQFDRPQAVAVDSQDQIIVADRFNNRVQVCDDQGGCTAFGSFGTAPGQFDEPHGIAVDSHDRIIVSDDGDNARIQVCDDQGTCTTFGSRGSGPGQFETPTGVAVDSQDRILVADYPNHRIQIFHKGFQINAGMSDAWSNPDTSGQGFFITVYPDIQYMFLAWFTFDTERPDESVSAILGEPGHRWLVAEGKYADNQAVLDAYFAVGGFFDTPTPELERIVVGTMIVEFTGCHAGTITYDFPDINRQGVVPIQRVWAANAELCEALQAQ